MRFAQVKEEPAQRAGDTEQSAWPTPLRARKTQIYEPNRPVAQVFTA